MLTLIRRKYYFALAILIATLIFGMTIATLLPYHNYKHSIRVVTTTSLYETGLLEELVKEFQKHNPNIMVSIIPVGSGEALRRASMGDAEIVISHAPSLEKMYIDRGIVVHRGFLAINQFVILGPLDDPAGIASKDPIDALRSIYIACENGVASFVSRDDGSGTNERERMLWNLAGLDPSGKRWYVRSGAGMARTLMLANEIHAYTISDIGTYLNLKDRLPNLSPLVTKGDELINIYSVYTVNIGKLNNTNDEAVELFVSFMLSEEAQRITCNYGYQRLGRPLFNCTINIDRESLMRLWNYMASLSELS